MAYTLGEAAKAAGKSKPTILNAIKTGKISAKKDEQQRWQIEPVELHRVYPPTDQFNSKRDVLDNHTEPAVLQAEINGLKAQLELLKSEHEDLRSERDFWRQQATGLLEDQRGKQAGVAVRVWRYFFEK